MKLAFISDIHANLPALRAVLEDLKKYHPDAIYCLGDIVNFAGWDNEVIGLLRERGITCIQGNHDESIGHAKKDFSFSYSNLEQKEFGYKSIELVNKTISKDNRCFLSNLPFMLQLDFRFPLQHIRLAMVHGSPESNNEYIHREMSDEKLIKMMDAVSADVLLMGHTHIPYHRAIYQETLSGKVYKHAINVGSVGKPKHGNNRSCYCILEINNHTDLNNASIDVHFAYVPYEVVYVIDHIHELGLSDAYTDFLRNG